MMDDDDDYMALFFAECDELLGDLQEHLTHLSGAAAGGEFDPEIVNAAFRAVHSIKGGAAAFGFDDLTGFAHSFESVMDGCRSERLQLTDELAHTLIRASDAIEALIIQARDGTGGDPDLVSRVASELQDYLDSPNPKADPPPVAETEPEAEPVAASENAETLSQRTVEITFAPHDDFLASGHDPLKILRGLKEFGALKTVAQGSVPALSEWSADQCPWSWMLRLSTVRAPDEITNFFELYQDFAEISVTEPADKADATEAPIAQDQEVKTEAAEPAAQKAKTPPSQASDIASAPSEKPKQAVKTKSGSAASAAAMKSLRVELARIDRLVNLVGEIVITQAALAQDLANLQASADIELPQAMEAITHQTRELQESVMAIRAQPVKSVFSRLPRVVRDLSDKLGKAVNLTLSGEHTEVDTTVIEELTEPLTHMLRNSMDHGLESAEERVANGKPATGQILLSAEHRGERVLIRLSDDGRGINRERVLEKAKERGLVGETDVLSPVEIDQLIFHPGFSTAQQISDVSGRGVGMDVVKRKIQSLGGRCTLRNTPGEGAEFLITLPLTLAVLEGMTIRSGGNRFILPLSAVVEALRTDDCQIEKLPDGGRVLAHRGTYLPVISLENCLGLPAAQNGNGMALILDTESGGLIVLLVDELLGQRQVVLKSLEANYRQVEGVSGATILGDGQVALILDVMALASLESQSAKAALQMPAPPLTEPEGVLP